MKKLVMEFIGTFFFISTIAITGNPFAIASMLMAWVYIGGYISGAHYNPMVSLAATLCNRLTWHEFYHYITAQTLGGIAAYVFAHFLGAATSVPQPQANYFFMAFVVEVLLAFVLAFVVLVVATSEKFRTSHVFGFAIGFTIPALAFLGSPISGGLFNPAIAIGAYLVGFLFAVHTFWLNLVLYVVGAFLGGYLAATAFKYFYGEKA